MSTVKSFPDKYITKVSTILMTDEVINYYSVGDVIVLLARDKQTQDTIDTKIINVRGI